MTMRTSSRMDNAKKWFGLSFCFMMNLITTVLSGTSRPPSKGQGQSLSDNLLLHQRMKRSWVWNQFFVLEEYTGTDPLYVGKVRSSMWDGESEIYYNHEMVNVLKKIITLVVNFTKEFFFLSWERERGEYRNFVMFSSKIYICGYLRASCSMSSWTGCVERLSVICLFPKDQHWQLSAVIDIFLTKSLPAFIWTASVSVHRLVQIDRERLGTKRDYNGLFWLPCEKVFERELLLYSQLISNHCPSICSEGWSEIKIILIAVESRN